MSIEYIERKTGEKCIEKVVGDRALTLFYGDRFWSNLFFKFFLPLIAHVPFFSQFYAFLQKRPKSAQKIEPFITAYGIDKSEFLKTEFHSFNDFFTRKLKPESRPIDEDPKVLITPAEGRVLVYSDFQQFSIKGKSFSIQDFLQNIELSNRYKRGSMATLRICPTDYHRFHFPCKGRAMKARLIEGPLFSVNPIALKKKISIYAENKRMITEIHSDLFGIFLYIEVGATFVGSIKQSYQARSMVKKGEEKGYFEFGGSCIVLFFERGKIRFDQDLIENTKKGLETRINFGQSLGVSL